MSAPGQPSFERSGVSVFLTSCSSELGERKPCGNGSRWDAAAATRWCPGSEAEEASDKRQNPMDGSGPRGRKAKRGETVGEVRNLEDGTSRGRQPRDDTDPPADAVEGE
jgi:hypothetical protein